MLVVFEGLNGVGKTTLINSVHQMLHHLINDRPIERYDIFTTKISTQVENILLSNLDINDVTKLFLLMAARSNAVFHTLFSRRSIIEERGNIVLFERFYHTSIAYTQHLVDNSDNLNGLMSLIYDMSKLSVFAIEPDLIFILDADINTIKKRLGIKFDKVIEDFDKIRQNYLGFANDPNTYILDATKDISQLTKEVVSKIMSRLYEPATKQL